MLPRNFEDKYHSRPHPLLMKCEARAISRDPVLMHAIELCLYARLVSSAWWRRRLDHAVLFKSFISVTHSALPNETGELYRSMVYPCPNRSVYFSVGSPGWWKLVIVQAGVPSWSRWRDAPLVPDFKCEVSHVNKQLPVDFMGVKCVSVECDQPRRWIHFKTYLIRLICRQSI